MGELDIVSNQNLSIEMFLIRLIHLKEIKYTLSKKMEMNPYKPLVQSIRKIMNQIRKNICQKMSLVKKNFFQHFYFASSLEV